MAQKRPTLPETNIAPENGWLEDVFPIGKYIFQPSIFRCYVSFREGTFFLTNIWDFQFIGLLEWGQMSPTKLALFCAQVTKPGC